MVKQKTFRKTVPLTEFQIERLQQLFELEGQDPVVLIRKAIDEYLNKRKLDFIPPEDNDITVQLKSRNDDPVISRAVWLSGAVNKYEFSVLILNMPSKSGIDKGRVSKLSIWDPVIRKNTNNFIGSCIVNYDRGWDIRPSKIAEPYYNKLKHFIDEYTDQFSERQKL